MRPLALVLSALPFAAACSTPSFTASRVVEMDVPLQVARSLRCVSHNGHIHVTPGASTDTVHVRAELQVRGFTQQEADDNLMLMAVRCSHVGDELRVHGEHPSELGWRSNPSYAFDLTVPEQIGVRLETHNGSVRTAGTTGAVAIETHNGNVTAEVQQPGFSIETHNGRIDLAIANAEALRGSAVTHNGAVDVALPKDAGGWLEASTHNGHVSAPEGVTDADASRQRLKARIGEADGGTLRVETHNGSIRFR